MSVSLSCYHFLLNYSSIFQQFQENEKRRYEAEKKRAEQKHQRKLEELQAASEYTVKELEQLQNEKRKYYFWTVFLFWKNVQNFNLTHTLSHKFDIKAMKYFIIWLRPWHYLHGKGISRSSLCTAGQQKLQ